MGLFRFIFWLASTAALAYVLFCVPVGSEPLAAHLRDIWQCDLVQKKVAEVRADVAVKLEERLAQAQTKTAAMPRDRTTTAERQELTRLIGKLAK